MKLVADARNWWRWHSMWALGVVSVAANLWLNTPAFQAMFPPRYVSVATPVVVLIVILLRVRDQQLKPRPPKPATSNAGKTAS